MLFIQNPIHCFRLNWQFLFSLVLYRKKVLIAGDFSIRVDDISDGFVAEFLILSLFLSQALTPHHTCGQVLPALGTVPQHVLPIVKNLGVISDQNLNLE